MPSPEWQNLLCAQAEAAATLTGLVFVAVSINLTRIVETPGLPERAAESILHFLQVFFVCTVAMVPRQPMRALAVEIFAIAILSWGIQSAGQVRYARSRAGHPLHWLMSRVVQTQLANIPFIVGAVYLSFGSQIGFFWLVPGFLFSFAAGVANAWVLLVEVVR